MNAAVVVLLAGSSTVHACDAVRLETRYGAPVFVAKTPCVDSKFNEASEVRFDARFDCLSCKKVVLDRALTALSRQA